MSCPTCDHTMHGLGERWFWCPRCGTVLNADNREHTTSIPSGAVQVRNWLHNPRYVTLGHLSAVMRWYFQAPAERQEAAAKLLRASEQRRPSVRDLPPEG